MGTVEQTPQATQGKALDQAASLRDLVSSRKKTSSRFEGLRSIAVVSGKGGVGRPTFPSTLPWP